MFERLMNLIQQTFVLFLTVSIRFYQIQLFTLFNYVKVVINIAVAEIECFWGCKILILIKFNQISPKSNQICPKKFTRPQFLRHWSSIKCPDFVILCWNCSSSTTIDVESGKRRQWKFYTLLYSGFWYLHALRNQRYLTGYFTFVSRTVATTVIG